MAPSASSANLRQTQFSLVTLVTPLTQLFNLIVFRRLFVTIGCGTRRASPAHEGISGVAPTLRRICPYRFRTDDGPSFHYPESWGHYLGLWKDCRRSSQSLDSASRRPPRSPKLLIGGTAIPRNRRTNGRGGNVPHAGDTRDQTSRHDVFICRRSVN